MDVEEDRNGNLWAWWLPPGWDGDPSDAFVTGSHLDSVPDGGAFDGPLGVVSAFAAVDIVRARGVGPDGAGRRRRVLRRGGRPVRRGLRRVAAVHRCAERRRALAGCATSTASPWPRRLTKAGRRSRTTSAPTRNLAERVGVFVELHVEQGRALDLVDRPIAVASAIWPHGRWQFAFRGEANHAGTTRLVDRRDPMLAFASSVHVGPVVCGRARRGRDVRQGPGHPQRRQRDSVGGPGLARRPCRRRGDPGSAGRPDQRRGRAATPPPTASTSTSSAESITPVVQFPDGPRERLQRALAHLGDIPVLPTAGRARRRHPVGAGADGNAVRAQPHRGVALADGVRRERRLQPRRARRWPT